VAGESVSWSSLSRDSVACWRMSCCPARLKWVRYGVDLPAFECVALPSLAAPPKGVVVIDELGKIKLASAPFRGAVSVLPDRGASIVATVHVFPHPFTDALKRHLESRCGR
jgi:nucleoside-triphosphatase THEP1